MSGDGERSNSLTKHSIALVVCGINYLSVLNLVHIGQMLYWLPYARHYS